MTAQFIKGMQRICGIALACLMFGCDEPSEPTADEVLLDLIDYKPVAPVCGQIVEPEIPAQVACGVGVVKIENRGDGDFSWRINKGEVSVGGSGVCLLMKTQEDAVRRHLLRARYTSIDPISLSSRMRIETDEKKGVIRIEGLGFAVITGNFVVSAFGDETARDVAEAVFAYNVSKKASCKLEREEP